MLEKIRPKTSQTDHLFIGTDRYHYFTTSWDAELKQLRTEKSYVDQADKSSRDSITHDRCLIDPSNQYMALFLYDGIVSILPLSSKGKRKGGSDTIDDLGDPVQTRISALFVKSCVFLHPRPKDKEDFQLALLYEDSHQKVCLSVRRLDFTAGGSGEPGFAELEHSLALRDDIELGASHLIAVPGPAHGLLVLAETQIIYFSRVDREALIEPLTEPTQFVAWSAVDDARWLLADDFGKLYLLMLLIEDSQVTRWKLNALGHTSRASTLVYLDDGLVFVGSHQGDSQVVKITTQGRIETVQKISNIAPILDFAIMDMGSRSAEGQSNEYSSGQARIVTGSGVFADGSLRSVRSGVGLEEQGLLGEMENATDLFALRSYSDAEFDDVLVISFINETRVFRFGAEGDVEEQSHFKSLELAESTIAISTLKNGNLVQVTLSSVLMIDMENGMILGRWSDPGGQVIVAASCSEPELILSLGGLEVATFDLSKDLQIARRKQFAEGQIACVHVSDIRKGVAFIGFWQKSEIAIVQTKDLEIVKRFRISDDDASVPRSLLLTRLLRFNSRAESTLLVSSATGEVVTFQFDHDSCDLLSRKVTMLGTQQATLKAIPRGDDGLYSVFATCEHPSLVYGSDDRIVFSAVTAENATSICYFDSELYPGAIAIATPEDIRIALVDTERTTHVQTMHVGELVRRIAYSSSTKAFGIGTIHRELKGTQEEIRSRFKLADEILFKELDTFDLNAEELVESVIRAELSENGDDETTERFIVGTTYVDEENDDATRGRILVFAVTAERKLKLITELPVKGACRALGCLDGKIVAALVKTVWHTLFRCHWGSNLMLTASSRLWCTLFALHDYRNCVLTGPRLHQLT